MYKLMIAGLIIVLVMLQSRIWTGLSSVSGLMVLHDEIAAQNKENKHLYQRNHQLAEKIIDLQNGLGTVEQEARRSLGMIKRDEIFYFIDK